MEASAPSTRFVAGDPVRAVAALAVLVFHAALIGSLLNFGGGVHTPIERSLGTPGANLDVGLFLFFSLSGYLIGRPFVASWLLGRELPSIRRYAERRVRRIVPLFWLVCAVLVIRLGVHGGQVGETLAVPAFAQWVGESTLRQHLQQAWTLDAELAFYALVPLLALLAARLPVRPGVPRLAVLATTVVALAAASLVALGAWPSTFDKTPVGALFAFAPGVALAAAEPWALPRLRGTGAGRAIAWGLAALAVAAAAMLLGPIGREHPALRDGVGTLLAGGVVGALLVWQWTAGRAPRLLDNPPLRALGRWSYGIYVLHWPLMLEIVRHMHRSGSARRTTLELLAMALPATIALAALTWRLVERPLIAAGHREDPEHGPASATLAP